jgi:hypothetical protein
MTARRMLFYVRGVPVVNKLTSAAVRERPMKGQTVTAYDDGRVPLGRLGVVIVLCASDGALASL